MSQLADLRRPVRIGASLEPAGRQPMRHPGELADRLGDGTDKQIGDDDTDGQQEKSESTEDEPRLRDTVRQIRVGHESANDGGVPLVAALYRDKDLSPVRIGYRKARAPLREMHGGCARGWGADRLVPGQEHSHIPACQLDVETDGRRIGRSRDLRAECPHFIICARDGAIGGDNTDQDGQRDGEGNQCERHRRGHQQGQAASHQPDSGTWGAAVPGSSAAARSGSSGAASRTPTLCTVCRYLGSVADSPSLRRSQDK